MKILVCKRPGGAFGYISDGWVNALRDRGHVVQRWDGIEQSWHIFRPDLYIGCSGHKQPIPARRSTKIAIHVNPYGPVDMKSINESEESIRWTLNQKPDVVFGYGHEDDRIIWSHWTTKHGIKWVPMPVAGDRILFKRIDVEKKYDVIYLGGRWAYKALTIDAYLLPLLKSCDYKLHGWGDWQSDLKCAGVIADDNVNAFLNSGKIGPCISEQHTHSYNIDIPERAFKLALCGTMFVHDAVVGIRRMIPSAIVATNPVQFKELCMYYIKNDSERIKIADAQRNEVLANHTYHHRMATLLNAVGFSSEAENMLTGK